MSIADTITLSDGHGVRRGEVPANRLVFWSAHTDRAGCPVCAMHETRAPTQPKENNTMTERTEAAVRADAVIADDMCLTDSGAECRVAGTGRRAENGIVLHLRRAADDAEARLAVLPDERATVRGEAAVVRRHAADRATAAHL